ncbi:FAD-dependent oxidoreductase [Brachybacterium sacelli]
MHSVGFDFVIVGGGVYGMATAYHLARLGAESVAVLERDEPAAGASGGLGQRGVRANRRDLRELPLMREANRVWPTLHEELGGETGYARTGGTYLIEGPASTGFKGIDAAETYARMQTAQGVPTELWDRERVRSVYPGISDDVQGASFVPTDGVASHERTTLSYAGAARRLGAQILHGTGAASLLTASDGRVTGVLTDGGDTITARREVILLANGGARQLVADATGVELPIWTIYPLASQLRTSTAARIPMLTGHETRPLSVKTLGNDVMLSGGWRGRATPNGPEVVAERLEGNIAVLQRIFPYLHDLEVVAADASRAESASVDQIPIIGRYAPHLFVAAGWSGHGWAIAPVVSRLIAEDVLLGSPSPLLAPFSPQRFR